MNIPKHYFHDKTVLVLLAINSVLALSVILFILLHLDPSKGSTPIVQYRSILGIDTFKPGSIAEFQLMALFAGLQYVFAWILSIRLYAHRRHLSVTILALTTFVLVLTSVVADALLR